MSKWQHDPDRRNEWYYIEGQPIGVNREEHGTRWAPAYVSDGLPAGRTNQYAWHDSLAEAQATAERLNAAEAR